MNNIRQMCMLAMLLLACGAVSAAPKPIKTWSFEKDTQGWVAQHDCTLKAADGLLQITNTNTEPFIAGPMISVNAPFKVNIRARSTSAGQARLYWTVKLPILVSSSFGEDAVIYFDVQHDGQWHDYSLPIDIDGLVTQLRIDPGKGIGQFDIQSISLVPFSAEETADLPSVKLSPQMKLTSDALTLTLDTQKHIYTITDKRTKRSWVTASAGSVRLTDGKILSKSSMELKLADRSQSAEYTCMVSLTKEAAVRFKITSKDNKSKLNRLNYPPRLESNLKNGALVLTQRCNGQLIDQKDKLFPTKSFGVYNNLGLDMPWVGVTDIVTGEGVMSLYETPANVCVDLKEDSVGRMWPQTRWIASMGGFGYSRIMSWQFQPTGGYVVMAKSFRAYAKQTGLLKTLAQKSAERPKVDWLRGATLIWGSNSSVEFAKQLKATGIIRAMIYGRPAGEELTAMTRLGFLTGEYDGYTDILEGPTGMQKDNIDETAYRDAGGAKALGWRTMEGLQYYTRSSFYGLRAADSYVPALLKTHPFTGRFLDVSSAVDLFEDYHPNHTFDRRQDMAYRRDLYKYMADHGLVVGGEHGKAWNADILDYNEGMASGPYWWEMPAGYLIPPKSRDEIKPNYLRYGAVYDKQIPLWELVFHDAVQSAWYWGDSSDYYYEVAPEMCDRKELANMLYGTMPLMWANNLGYGWDRNRSRFVETYWKTCRLNAVLFGQELKRHEFLSADRMLQRSVFANGATTVVNFDSKPRVYEKLTLAPNGFYVTAPGITQSKLMVGKQAITSVLGKNYLWVQTSSMQQVGDVRVHGKLGLFQAKPGQWNLVLDSQHEAFVDIAKRIPLPKGGNYRVFELKADGELLRELSGLVKAGQLTIPAGKGLRLYGVVTNAASILMVTPQSGMLQATDMVMISAGGAPGVIRYTVDGSTPTAKSPAYTKPLVCEWTTLKAARFVDGKLAGPVITGNYRRVAFQSGVCRFSEPAVSVSVSVKGAKKLTLLVDDGGDGPAHDRADWADAKLYTASGETVYLSDLKPVRATQNSGLLGYDLTFDGKPITIGTTEYKKGISTHADSDIQYELNGKYERFEVQVGSDATVTPFKQGSVRFRVVLD